MKFGNSVFILVVLNIILLYNAEFSVNFLLHNLLPANLVVIAASILIDFSRNKLAKYLGQSQNVPLERSEIRRQKQELQIKLQDLSQAIFIPDDIKQRLEEKYQAEYAQISRYAKKERRSHVYVFVSFLMNSLLEMENKELDQGSVEKATQIRGVYQRLAEYDKSHPSV